MPFRPHYHFAFLSFFSSFVPVCSLATKWRPQKCDNWHELAELDPLGRGVTVFTLRNILSRIV